MYLVLSACLTKEYAEQVSLAVTSWTSIYEVLGPNIGWDTGCPD
jgi:hypothetical protein